VVVVVVVLLLPLLLCASLALLHVYACPRPRSSYLDRSLHDFLQVVKVLGLSKNSGSRVSRRIPDLTQLRGIAATPE
jgi:hypothetical protein